MSAGNPAFESGLPSPADAAKVVAADLRKTARLLVFGPETRTVPRPRIARIQPRAVEREHVQEIPVARVATPVVNESDIHDKALMAKIAQGDERALGELITKHQGAVYGTIAKMLGDPTEAQDLAQQVFVRVYRAAGSYRATAQFKTWIFTIVRNLVFNEHRRRSRATLISLHPVDNEHGHGNSTGLDLPDTANRTPDAEMLQAEMLRKIDEAILALPEQQRLAIVLRRYDEFSYEQIAEILKTSVPATKSLLFRARETLRLALRDYLDQEA